MITNYCYHLVLYFLRTGSRMLNEKKPPQLFVGYVLSVAPLPGLNRKC